MAQTNRIIRSLSEYFASKDDNRPALQGIICAGTTLLATDGMKLAVVEGREDDFLHFEDTDLYRIDEKQALNADFVGEAHEFIEDEIYPKAHTVLPTQMKVHHAIRFEVDVLMDVLKLLKRAKMQHIALRFPDDMNRGVVFEGQDVRGKSDITVRGLLMPCYWSEYSEGFKPFENPIDEAFYNKVKHIIEDVNDETYNEDTYQAPEPDQIDEAEETESEN